VILLEFCVTLHISGMGLELENSNLAYRLNTGNTNEKNAKLSQGGSVGRGSCDLLLKFWDPTISRALLKLETLNLAPILSIRGRNEKYAKLGEI